MAQKGKVPPRPPLGSRLPSGFHRIGSPRERALVLALSGQHLAAAELLMEAILDGHPDLNGGVAANTLLATLAARYFAAGGAPETAAELFEALGQESLNTTADDQPRDGVPVAEPRPDLLRRQESDSGVPFAAPWSQDVAEASPSSATPLEGRERRDTADEVCHEGAWESESHRSVSRTAFIARGARLAASGRILDAAGCYLKAGEAKIGLELLSGIPEGHPRYADAARLMIRILVKHRLAEPTLLAFVQPHLRRGPRDEAERSLFRSLRAILEGVGALGDATQLRTSPELELGKQPLAQEPALGGTSGERAEPLDVHGSAPTASPSEHDAPLHKDPRHAATMLTEVPKLPEDGRILGQAVTRAVAIGELGSWVPSPGDSEIDRPRGRSLSGSNLPFQRGTLVEGRYRIQGELGSGGMATVLRAWDGELEESIALKVYRQGMACDEASPEGLARFRQELKVSRRLSHPNLIRLYDIGTFLGFRYLTMELLEGHSLNELLGEPVAPRLGLDWLRQIASGLGEAHRHGVIHRDIKPENIFVTRDGVLKIMDFGIAKSRREKGVTLVGTTAGTPEYMAPEQINRFSEVGGAADQYSLGVVAYQIFTGALPFQHSELVPLLMAHVQDPPPSLREVSPDVPQEIEALVLGLLAKAPADRYSSCDVLVEALEGLLTALPG